MGSQDEKSRWEVFWGLFCANMRKIEFGAKLGHLSSWIKNKITS